MLNRVLLIWLVLFGVVLAAPTTIEVRDIMFRRDVEPTESGQGPNMTTLRVSSTLHNSDPKKRENLTVGITWSTPDGRVLRSFSEALPALPGGQDHLYWAPPLIDAPPTRITVKVEVMSGTQVIATGSARE